MSKARSNRPIGLAGGVLSAAGLCLGILSLAKKGERSGGPGYRRPIEFRPERTQDAREILDQAAPQFVTSEVAEWHKPELPGSNEPGSINLKSTDADGIVLLASSTEPVIEEFKSTGWNGEFRPVRERIAGLAGKGESALAIAQALGISVGEVQLTLKLQQYSGSAIHGHD